MKSLQTILSSIILISIAACEPPVTFNEPQPADTDNLLKFPKRLQGQYLSLADNSMLLIGDKFIQRTYDYDYRLHQNQLDSHSRLSGDTIVDLRTGQSTLIKREGDSLVIHIHYTDTLFQLNEDNVVRKFKGYYFINTRYNHESWEVKKIKLAKGQLVISRISASSELDDLREIMESAQDTVPPYQFKANKKQFKKFIRNNGFSDGEIFIRQKKGYGN